MHTESKLLMYRSTASYTAGDGDRDSVFMTEATLRMDGKQLGEKKNLH